MITTVITIKDIRFLSSLDKHLWGRDEAVLLSCASIETIMFVGVTHRFHDKGDKHLVCVLTIDRCINRLVMHVKYNLKTGA